MALTQIKFAPGVDKQDTSVGAIGRWVDSDNVRWRYGLPEKVGGWQSLLQDSIVGVVRKQHAFVDTEGNRYIGIGTDKFLLLFFEGQLFDITPVKTTITGATFTFNGSTTITITTSAAHGLSDGDIIQLDSVTLPGGTGLSASDFEDKTFQVITTPTATTFTITFTSSGSAASGGSTSIIPYEPVGPAAQTYGYGFGISQYGGSVQGAQTTTLNGALLADTAGTGGSGTAITLASVTGFPTGGGTVAIGTELITYTGISSNDLTGIVRGTNGTAVSGTTGQAHSNGATVTNATDFSGWGSAVEADTVTLEPGLGL